VDLGFLDYTSLERRRHFCEEEVRLNRRLAPDVYLGVVPIVRGEDGHLRVGGPAEPADVIEWAVEMVRLPEERMLGTLLDEGVIDNEMLGSVVDLLVRFHRSAATGPGVDEHGERAAVAANVEENFEHVRGFAGAGEDAMLSEAQLAFLEARQGGFLADNEALFERRIAEHRIREGHGDLHAGNLCFTDDGRIVAYDCIEFNRRFRCGDVASEVAFLAMDLDQRGYPAFSSWLVWSYAERSGDGELQRLMPFYKGYRAVVRGKVAGLTATDPEVDDVRSAELRREAMRYFQLAACYELPPALILMCGLPATGKSWLAERIARALRAVVLHTDVRRKVLAGLRPTDRAAEEVDQGLYSPERKRETYRSLLPDAIELLEAGHSVVVDATFSKREQRLLYVDAATRLGLPYYVVHVTAPEDLVRSRLELRAKDPHATSDADLEVYLGARESFEPPDETPEGHVLEVPSGVGPPEARSGFLVDRMIELHERP
jgi:aminoglycoside phosphotransferase family enzyme